MDKRIVDALVKFGLITNINVDAAQYDDVDELIAKGIITVPGARETVQRIIDSLDDVETPTITETIVNPDPVIDEVPVTEPVIDETPAEEATIVEVETVVEETANEPIVVETPEAVAETPKKRKTTKKAETTAE